MKYIVMVLALVGCLMAIDSASAIGRNKSSSVSVQRSRGNVQVQKVVAVNNNHHNQQNVQVQRVVVDNHHHNQAVVQKVVVAQPVYQDVVVERVVVDNHGHTQRVRSVERIRVR